MLWYRPIGENPCWTRQRFTSLLEIQLLKTVQLQTECRAERLYVETGKMELLRQTIVVLTQLRSSRCVASLSIGWYLILTTEQTKQKFKSLFLLYEDLELATTKSIITLRTTIWIVQVMKQLSVIIEEAKFQLSTNLEKRDKNFCIPIEGNIVNYEASVVT